MIEKFYDIITKIENFVDGIMIVDENCIIKYNKQFNPYGFTLDETFSIGKTPMDVYPNLTAEDSTCYRAVTYGENTVNQIQRLRYHTGEEVTVLDTTFPVLDNGKIIGAVSTSRYVAGPALKNSIDLSSMTTTRTGDMYTIDDMVGQSPVMTRLKQDILRVSRTNATVLIHGETGTGKELVAQSIHSHSPRSGRPFVSQNCAAIPTTLLESIFFGTTRGSYTGAENRPGIFELADGGTIFLDEINSMDLFMQAKLLKAIEEKKITRIGGREPKRMNVRILAAVGVEPKRCLAEQTIRPDLYYRLTGVQVRVPSLRERKSDLPVLTAHFLQLFNREMQLSVQGVEEAVMELFMRYDWPGNVREFRNVLEGSFHVCDDRIIRLEDLPELTGPETHNALEPTPPHTGTPEPAVDQALKDAVEGFEKAYILSKAEKAPSQASLAEQLGISRQTLHNKLRKYRIQTNRSPVGE